VDGLYVLVGGYYRVQFRHSIKVPVYSLKISIGAGQSIRDDHFEAGDCLDLLYIDHRFTITCEYIFSVLIEDLLHVFSLQLDQGIVLVVWL
jgi:hypothetical protein